MINSAKMYEEWLPEICMKMRKNWPRMMRRSKIKRTQQRSRERTRDGEVREKKEKRNVCFFPVFDFICYLLDW